jgi:uncharacterized protein DUF4192
MDTDHRPHRSTPRITGPGELLQAVPYLLGFHPATSLVLVGIDAGCLVVTARLDLTDAEAPGVLEHTIDAMTRGGSTSLVAAIYDDGASADGSMPGPWAELLRGVDEYAERVACDLLDVLLVARGRWWSLLCGAPECCPPAGREVPATPSAFAAAATYEGMVALPDRAALEALLEPLPQDQRAQLDAAIEAAEHTAVAAVLAGHASRSQRSVKRALFAAARESCAPGWAGPEDETVARFGVALGTVAIRDAVWMAIDDGRLDARPLWRQLARRLPAPYDAAPLFLFGWAAWRAGDGALAGIAAERAVRSDPHYSAADLLLAALARGVDPRRLPKLRLPRSA